ncbi:MAG: NlpC/P60 family protein [Eubacteriales bacterium]|nr:NlpC/P60 family protein [Eubacteriales bacterium]
MKKNIVRCSMLTVAAFSLLLGGISNVSVKEQVGQTPIIVGKAIENHATDADAFVKGTIVKNENKKDYADAKTGDAVEDTAATQEEAVADDSTGVEVEEKAAKVESNQVVANIDSYLNIRESASEDADVVGKFFTGNVGTIVEKGDEWSLVSSGNAYGYVNNDYLLFGDDAEAYIENNCDQVAKVTAETLNVRAEDSTDSDVVNQIDEGAKLTILDKEGEWIKVATSDDNVGYVSKDFVYIDYVYETAITVEEEQAIIEAQEAEIRAQEEAERQQAQEEAAQNTQTQSAEPAPQQAPAKQETATSTDVSVSDSGSSSETVQSESGSGTGQEVVNYAVQFVGNPYVWGGTSLTNGADCSGFVQSVYKHFGYSLPRVAASQATVGKQVSLDSLQPGDLLFYGGSNIGHVAIYMGGGQIVHASNSRTGITISNYNYRTVTKAVRIIY